MGRPALDDLSKRHLLAHLDLAAVVGRTVGHQKNLRAALGQRLAHTELAPDVLADRNAETHAPHIDRPGHLAGVEDALLVELAVIGQIDLVAHANDLAVVDNGDGIVALAVLGARIADDHRRAAVGSFRCQLLDRLPAGFEKGRADHEILGRVARDHQLGEENEIRAVTGGIRPALADLCDIAGDIADSRVELGNRDAEHVRRGIGFRRHGLCLNHVRTNENPPIGDIRRHLAPWLHAASKRHMAMLSTPYSSLA